MLRIQQGLSPVVQAHHGYLISAGLESAIIPSDETKTTTTSAKAIEKGQRINRKAYKFIYARLHDNISIGLSPEVCTPAKPNAMALWKELGVKYGGEAIHELVATIDVVLTTRVAEGEDPRDRLNDTRNAFLKLNANSIPIDDTFFALIILKPFRKRSLQQFKFFSRNPIYRQPKLSRRRVTIGTCGRRRKRTSQQLHSRHAKTSTITNRNAGFVNSNPPGSFHCIYYPGANFHNTVDCREAKQLVQSNGRNAQSANSATVNVATIEDVMSYATTYIAGKGSFGRQTEFHLDSGASGYLTCDKDLLVNPVPYRSAVTIGEGSRLYSAHKCSIQVTDSIKFDNALYVPCLACKLLSLRELFSNKMNIRFTKDEAAILDETHQSILGTATFERQNGTYTLRTSPSIPSAMLATSTDYVLSWYNGLGHLHFGEIVKLGKAGWLEKDWESNMHLQMSIQMNIFENPVYWERERDKPHTVTTSEERDMSMSTFGKPCEHQLSVEHGTCLPAMMITLV